MLFLDTRTLESRLLPLPANAAFMVVDSGVPRSLAASAYNQRRSECEQATQLLGVRALRDITDLSRLASLPAPLDRRARHVVTENQRVLEAADGVDAERFGELMNASHASLRDDYEVSVQALDTLVEILQRHPKVYGARLTGAGFGGASVALVERGAQAAIQASVLEVYERKGYRGSVLA
jgi:galactokinase